MANEPLFMDSFDHYTSIDDIVKKWSTRNGGLSIVGNGRYQNCLQLIGVFNGTFLRRNLDTDHSELTVGFAIRLNELPPSGVIQIFNFSDAGTNGTRIVVDSLGRIQAYNDNTLLYQSPNETVTALIFHHVKFHVKFATDNTGDSSLKFNSVEIGSVSGVPTSTSGIANQVNLCGPGLTWVDDVWVIDPTVTDESLYGDQIVIYCGANGAGQTNDWTPSAGTNSQNVDDNPATDASYNATTSVDAVDLYACQDLPETVTGVVAIQSVLRLRKDDANPVSVAPVLGNGTSLTVGNAISLGQEYGFYLEQWGSNPNNDDADWTPSDVNALQVGPKRTV